MTDSKDIISTQSVNKAYSFRGKKEPIIDYKNKSIEGIEIISSIQERIVFSEKRINTIFGCAGSRKTDTLCKYGLKQYREKKNVLFLTLISSVTDEIKNRVSQMFEVNLNKQGNHYFGPAAKSKPTVEISTFDAFIYKQLDSMQTNASVIYDDVVSVDESTYKQRMYKLLNSSHDKFIMKNDKLANIILIDEFQDLEMDKIKIIINILKLNPHVKCMIIGDYLQTIFERSIMVDDQVVDHPFELWQKSFIAEESYEEFEINICYRCPESHVKLINHLIGGTEPRKKYGISDMEAFKKDAAMRSLDQMSAGPSTSEKYEALSNKPNHTIHKPFIFIHEDIGSGGRENTNGSYIADQAFRIVNSIIAADKEEIKYSDVTVLMLKSNGQPVFRQLEDLFSKERFHIHETKGDGYHDRIDWSKSENKATALSIHGYKGRGNKIVLLLGLNNFNMPRRDNVGTPKELIDYSLFNVGLSRSTKYLVIGITSSSPTKYLYDRRESFEDFAFCSWKDDLLPPVYKAVKESLYTSKWNRGEGNSWRCPKDKMLKLGKKHWHNDKCKIRRDQLLFDPYFYSDRDVYPKHRVASVAESVCDAIDDPEEILAGSTKGIRKQFGKISSTNSGGDEYEKKIMGIVAEWIVNRYLFVNSADIDFLKYMTFMFEMGNDKLVYFTNNETLLNLVADKEINSFAIHHIYDEIDRKSNEIINIWKQLFAGIVSEHEQLLNRDKSGLADKINSLTDGLPRMIVHSNFKDVKFMDQLQVLCNKVVPNDKIQSEAFWNFGLFQMLLFEKIRTPYLSSYYGRINHGLDALCANADEYCKIALGKNKLNKQLSHSIMLTVPEELILGAKTQNKRTKPTVSASDIYDETPESESKKMSKPFIISGRSDLYDHSQRKIIEIKASGFTEISNAWIIQALTYCCLPLNSILNGGECAYEPRRLCVVNLLKGCSYELELPADFNRKKCMEIIMRKLKWPQDVIFEYFATS